MYLTRGVEYLISKAASSVERFKALIIIIITDHCSTTASRLQITSAQRSWEWVSLNLRCYREGQNITGAGNVISHGLHEIG